MEAKDVKKEEQKNSFLYTSKGKFVVSAVVTAILLVCVIVAGLYVLDAPHRVTDSEVLANRTTEDLRWFEFQLDGETYQIPSGWETFGETGWVLEENPILGPGEKKILYANKDQFRIQLTLTNDQSDLQNASRCTVTQITMKANQDEAKNPAFFAVNGLTFRMGYEEMQEALGSYDQATIQNGLYVYLYRYGNTAAIQIALDETNGISEIVLNRIAE